MNDKAYQKVVAAHIKKQAVRAKKRLAVTRDQIRTKKLQARKEKDELKALVRLERKMSRKLEKA
ncbi:MAG TPA: hypothetical protein PLE74_07570 [Candidatus Cloacimonadota bacterium]|nr:hypothetical protein [Candidatus Cloacimonadota bacterium]